MYFAKYASYSLHNTYSQPDNLGHKHVFLCRTIIGKFCRGNSNMKSPPIDEETEEQYHTLVDDVNDPRVYVCSTDNQAIPRYLLTVK